MKISPSIAVIVIAALLASCAGQGNTTPPTKSYLMRVDQDPTLSATRQYLKQHPFQYVNKAAQNGCGGMQAVRSAQFCVNATPTPPNMNWTYGFLPGNVVVFGPYSEVVAGGTFKGCIGDTAHTVLADALAVAGVMQGAVSQWRTGPNAAAIDALLASYAAGEIGAAAFLAGVISMTDVGTIALIVGAAGLTLFALYTVARCASSSDSLGMERRVRRTVRRLA